jgi:transcriptional regulator with XRE-family HTH domain
MSTPRRRPLRSLGQTKLARLRIERGPTREEFARAVGTSTTTLARLESGRLENASFRLLNNCALALGVALADVVEDSWHDWWDPYGGTPTPPDPQTFWREP